jgi:hypothetical protein
MGGECAPERALMGVLGQAGDEAASSSVLGQIIVYAPRSRTYVRTRASDGGTAHEPHMWHSTRARTHALGFVGSGGALSLSHLVLPPTNRRRRVVHADAGQERFSLATRARKLSRGYLFTCMRILGLRTYKTCTRSVATLVNLVR